MLDLIKRLVLDGLPPAVLSKQADDASHDTLFKGPEAHQKAADAHDAAAKAHRSAGNFGQAKEHEAKAEEHKAQAEGDAAPAFVDPHAKEHDAGGTQVVVVKDVGGKG